MMWSTPYKTNLEPEKGPLEKGKTYTHYQFVGSMLVFGGISLKLASLLCSLPSKHSRSFAIIGRLERQNMRKERERERAGSQGRDTFKIERLDTWKWGLFPKWWCFLKFNRQWPDAHWMNERSITSILALFLVGKKLRGSVRCWWTSAASMQRNKKEMTTGMECWSILPLLVQSCQAS